MRDQILQAIERHRAGDIDHEELIALCEVAMLVQNSRVITVLAANEQTIEHLRNTIAELRAQGCSL